MNLCDGGPGPSPQIQMATLTNSVAQYIRLMAVMSMSRKSCHCECENWKSHVTRAGTGNEIHAKCWALPHSDINAWLTQLRLASQKWDGHFKISYTFKLPTNNQVYGIIFMRPYEVWFAYCYRKVCRLSVCLSRLWIVVKRWQIDP